ncbi:MAG: sugar ABC transporter permease [Vallitalea sp.]|nr:sugar ABC transporter permease [Vallitalea sp.]
MNKSKKAGLLSTLFMGLGQILVNKEYIKGIIFSCIELIVLVNIKFFIKGISGLISLGEVTGYTGKNIKLNDHSIFMLIDGIIVLIICLLFIIIYIINIREAIHQGRKLDQGLESPSFKLFIRSFWDRSFPYIMSTPAFVGITFFVLLPILFGMCIAFTNYSSPDHVPPGNLVDWVGLQNLFDMIRLPMWNNTFIGIFTWTFIWAIISTASVFFGGLFVALLINSSGIKYKKLWRTIYILPYAIPSLISLLIFRNMFNGQFGPINLTLKEIGFIDSYFGIVKNNIGWLSDPTTAKITIILVNFWLGFPYFMALLTGIMTSIPHELYEAAEIDGANKFKKFKSITLPMVVISTTPLIIMSFAANFNNFNVIYFLTDGGPTGVYDPASGAGATDILITWIYKLTYDNQNYNIAALMSLLIFIIIGTFSVYNFTRTKAFKDDEF